MTDTLTKSRPLRALSVDVAALADFGADQSKPEAITTAVVAKVFCTGLFGVLGLASVVTFLGAFQ